MMNNSELCFIFIAEMVDILLDMSTIYFRRLSTLLCLLVLVTSSRAQYQQNRIRDSGLAIPRIQVKNNLPLLFY